MIGPARLALLALGLGLVSAKPNNNVLPARAENNFPAAPKPMWKFKFARAADVPAPTGSAPAGFKREVYVAATGTAPAAAAETSMSGMDMPPMLKREEYNVMPTGTGVARREYNAAPTGTAPAAQETDMSGMDMPPAPEARKPRLKYRMPAPRPFEDFIVPQ